VGIDQAGNTVNDTETILFSSYSYLIPVPDLYIDQSLGLIPTFSVEWNTSALVPNQYTIYLNGEEFESSIWNGGDISSQLSGTHFGINLVRLEVSTQGGLTLSDELIVFIDDFRSPIITSSIDLFRYDLDASLAKFENSRNCSRWYCH
jgi:hypothetical protein